MAIDSSTVSVWFRHQLSAQLDPQNAGVLIVFLNRPGQGMSSDEVTDRIENNNCTIM